jgi:adenosine deaminase
MKKPEPSMKLDRGVLKSLPKVLLHEHLDGVLRPKTVIELARSAKYDDLPTGDPDELARWFHQGANQGSLPKYLEGFAHTIAVMQTEEALERVGGRRRRSWGAAAFGFKAAGFDFSFLCP